MAGEARTWPRCRRGRRLASASPRNAGFLLVEALATLAISAVILAALGSVLGMMSRQADTLAARTQRMDVAGHGLGAIARELGSAARARWAGPGPRPFVFLGFPDRVMFALDRLDGVGRPETIAILLQSFESEDGAQVVRGESPLSPFDRGPGDLDFGSSGPLYAGRTSLRFAYVQASARGGPEILLDTWTTGDALPIAVRVAFTDPASGAILSSLRVPIRVGAEPGCAAPRKAFCSRVDEQAVAEESGEPVPFVVGNPPAQGGR